MTGPIVATVMQDALVGLVVAAAFAYAGVKLMPAAWRRDLARKASSFARQVGGSDVLARRVEAKLSSGGACGSCDSCKACATPAEPDSSLPTFEAPSAHRRIPIRRAS
jgi:hypothetical protein